MAKKSKSINKNAAKNNGLNHALFGIVFGLIVAFFVGTTDPNISLHPEGSDDEKSYYNLLAQGFRVGHLYLNKEAPPALAGLADPYDPAVNHPYIGDVVDLSYFKGKLYLYFGVTPVLVLYWPYAILTGGYLSDKDAVAVFFATGFAVVFCLLRAMCRCYFPGASVWMLTAGTLALGLTMALALLGNIYEVAITCAFAFTATALAAIWCAIHARLERRILWLLLASVAYGLAIGSRPSLLFGAIILLMPVVKTWHEAKEPGSSGRKGLLLTAAIGPVFLIGLGLMLYNDLRFGNPFEFGWHYQLNSDFRAGSVQQFSLRFFWFDLRNYFFQPVSWSGQFPFLQVVPLPPLPRGYDPGTVATGCGIPINYPWILLAFAVPLVWKNRDQATASGLRWFVASVLLLFVICTVTICLFYNVASRFELDFVPWLMLLSVVGFLEVERRVSGLPLWRKMVRGSWCGLLAYSFVFNLLFNHESRAEANCLAANLFGNEGRWNEAIAQYRKALTLWPQCPDADYGLAIAYYKTGEFNESMVQLQKTLELRPRYAIAYLDLANVFLRMGRGDEAIPNFQKGLEIEPGLSESYDPALNNNAAWSLATDPQAGKRNGILAVKLAEGACQKTHYQVTGMVGTLAAAYAEAGRFDDAIATAQKAIVLARQNGESDLLEKNQELLALYLKHQPYREPVKASSP